jgi:hypothetical protein
MIFRATQYVTKQPAFLALGVVFGFVLAALFPAWSDYIYEQYNDARPVVKDWKVLEAHVEGNDLLLSGVMHKTRDCLLVPPAIARDNAETAYIVEADLWRAKDASLDLQPFGPWKVVGGAGRKLTFTLVYVCSGNHPTIVRIGNYP